MQRLTFLSLLLIGSWFSASLRCLAQTAAPHPGPSVLIVNGSNGQPANFGDFGWFRQLNQHGFQIDVHFLDEHPNRPFNWELIKSYNCLIFLCFPLEEHVAKSSSRAYAWKIPPYRNEFLSLIDHYLAQGGGIFVLPDLNGYGESAARIKDIDDCLKRWGARLPLEALHDPTNESVHPRDGVTFLYTQNVASSPVSTGVYGIWFPVGPVSTSTYSFGGQAIDVSPEWMTVVRGSNTSFTADPVVGAKSMESDLAATMYRRPNPKTPPSLYAIRTLGEGRIALTVLWPIFTVHGGTAWIHDGAVIDKGIGGRPSDFGRLFENTVRWLSAPSLKNGQLGGYVQDPLQLVHPHFRKTPEEFFPKFEIPQNPTDPNKVFRGLVGARTVYSGGRGSVADYAAAARRAGLDFLVFLESFGDISEPTYRKLEIECQTLSNDSLLLIPGLRLQNNIGNHMFVYGRGIPWPSPSQLDGPARDQLRTQCFDKEGLLAYNDEDAKNWLWENAAQDRNIGYYDFRDHQGVLVRNLRLFGILGVMTYRDRKLVEDITPDYLSRNDAVERGHRLASDWD